MRASSVSGTFCSSVIKRRFVLLWVLPNLRFLSLSCRSQTGLAWMNGYNIVYMSSDMGRSNLQIAAQTVVALPAIDYKGCRTRSRITRVGLHIIVLKEVRGSLLPRLPAVVVPRQNSSPILFGGTTESQVTPRSFISPTIWI